MSDPDSPQTPTPPNDPANYPPAQYGAWQQSGGPQPPYPPPPNYYQQHPPYAMPRTTNGLAIASMVLGILWIYWIGSILALIFGYVARNQIRERNQGGDGMAIAGIVLGWIGVGFMALTLMFVVIGA